MSSRRAVNIFFFINGFVYSNWATRIPALQDQFELDNSSVGIVLLVHSIGAFITMPLTGYLISKFTSKWVTIFSALLFPFIFLTIPFMTNFYTLLIPFFVMGSVTGMMDVATNAQAVEVEKELQKPIMTMFHALYSIGMVQGGITGSIAINIDLKMAAHFPVIAALAIIALALSSKYLFPDKPQSSIDDPIFILPKGPVVILGVIAFCCMMGEGAIADWSTIYMKEIVQSSEVLFAMGLTAFAAMMTMGRLFGDKGRMHYGNRNMLLYGGVISLIGMSFVLMKGYVLLSIIGFGMVGLGLSNIVPIVYSLAGSMKGIKPGVGIAMSTTIGYSGFMVGPPLIGFVADVSSLYYSMILLAFIFLFMFVLIRIKV